MEEGKGDIEDVFDVNSGIAKDLSLEEVVGMWNIKSMNQKKKQKAVFNLIKEEKINVCRKLLLLLLGIGTGCLIVHIALVDVESW
ncbi:hypothetical protein Tco_0296303 [Tanacetum coccineum]